MALRHSLLVVCLVTALAAGAPAQDLDGQSVPDEPALTGGQNPEAGTEKQENPPEPESHGTRLQWKDLPKNVWHDEKTFFTSPLRINRQNAKWWALFGVGAVAFLATDRKVATDLPNSNTQLSISRWASRLGADYSIYPLTALFYFYGKADDNPRARDTARIGIQAMMDAEISVNILKTATQRPRPVSKDQPIGFFKGGDAFPSGHSIKSWALARVIAREFDDNKLVPIAAYGLATTVSLARVAGRRHSPSDAFVGAVMGFLIGDYVYRHHHAPSKKSTVALSWIADHVDLQFGGRPRMMAAAPGR